MVLSELPRGQEATISYVSHPHQDKQIQLNAMGFDPGESVKLLMKAPMGNPLQVKVGASLIAIHTDDAQYVYLHPEDVKGSEQK